MLLINVKSNQATAERKMNYMKKIANQNVCQLNHNLVKDTANIDLRYVSFTEKLLRATNLTSCYAPSTNTYLASYLHDIVPSSLNSRTLYTITIPNVEFYVAEQKIPKLKVAYLYKRFIEKVFPELKVSVKVIPADQ